MLPPQAPSGLSRERALAILGQLVRARQIGVVTEPHQCSPGRMEVMPVPAYDTLDELVADVLASSGRTLDDLSVTEAIDLTDTLRAIAALRTLSPFDSRLAADVIAVAAFLERSTDTG